MRGPDVSYQPGEMPKSHVPEDFSADDIAGDQT